MKNKFVRRNPVTSALVVSAVLCMGSGIAVAGEVDGKGNPVPGGVNGKSECSFSGQQDDAIADAGVFKGDRVQSWGQLPKPVRDFLKSIGVSPGVACNPKKSGG